jgi:pimeloyl-ACP methyl ester carboxylesterase
VSGVGEEGSADASGTGGGKSGLDWQPPQPGPAVRGTVIVLPGRGEHAGVYERLGRRLAFDAYAVYALDVTPQDDPVGLRDRVAAITAQATAPVVLIGSDTGALHALALVAEGKVDVEGVVLAAIPGPRQATPAAAAASVLSVSGGADAWERELAARTTCPTHRGKLTEDAAFRRGSLFEPVPDRLASLPVFDGSDYAEIGTVTLVLHGGADPIAPVEQARSLAARLPRAEFAVVPTAPHDVLNDSTHRSVAALIVQWLERLRGGPGFARIVELEDLGAKPIPVSR